jgi:hypothetical protein
LYGATELKESESQKVPNVHCKLLTVSSDKKDIILTLELFAYKEKLLKEQLCLECPETKTLLMLVVLGRVLGKCNQNMYLQSDGRKNYM